MTVLIVEDHPLFQGALVQLAPRIAPGSPVVAVQSAEEGLRRIETSSDIAVILLDLHLPGISGTEAVTAFHRKVPTVPIIVLSAAEDRRIALSALRAGARLFLSKAVPPETLVEAAQRVIADPEMEKSWISLGGVTEALSGAGDWLGDDLQVRLTPRQQIVLTLLSQGLSNKEIAEQMGLAEITVKIHLSAIFRVLGVNRRTQAVLAARRMGLEVAPGAAEE